MDQAKKQADYHCAYFPPLLREININFVNANAHFGTAAAVFGWGREKQVIHI